MHRFVHYSLCHDLRCAPVGIRVLELKNVQQINPNKNPEPKIQPDSNSKIMEDLPLELQELIVHFLHDTPSSWPACSRINKRWLALMTSCGDRLADAYFAAHPALIPWKCYRPAQGTTVRPLLLVL